MEVQPRILLRLWSKSKTWSMLVSVQMLRIEVKDATVKDAHPDIARMDDNVEGQCTELMVLTYSGSQIGLLAGTHSRTGLGMDRFPYL